MTWEFFEDIFKQRDAALICTSGLPENAKLVNIITTDDNAGYPRVIAFFEDGKQGVTHQKLKFEAVYKT